MNRVNLDEWQQVIRMKIVVGVIFLYIKDSGEISLPGVRPMLNCSSSSVKCTIPITANII